MPNNASQPNYLFQAAVGRSGSTILRRSIGLHPEVYYNGKENNVVQDVAEVAHRNCTSPSRVVAMDVDSTTYDNSFRQLICDLVWPDASLQTRPVHFAAINPTASNLDYLCQAFPNAKIVCLIRNGIEVICSRIKFQSFASFDFQSQCKTWMRCEEMIEWGERNPERFSLFRHEWLYDPSLVENKLNELCDWVGINPSEEVINNIRSVNDCMPTTQAPVEFSTMGDAQKRAYFGAKGERWRSWTIEQREEFVEICGGLMNRMGYSIPFISSQTQNQKAA